MKTALVAALLSLSSCGDERATARPVPVPVPVPAPVVDDEPQHFVLRDVSGADRWQDCLGKPVVALPDGTHAVGYGAWCVGSVVKWLAPGEVEVEAPLRGEK